MRSQLRGFKEKSFNRSAEVLLLIAMTGSPQCFSQPADTPDATKNPFAGNPAAIAAGKALYSQTCEGCHGGDAQGGRGPALANGKFSHGSEDDDLFRTIRAGIPGTQMPAFGALPTDDAWRIITYLRSLNTNSAQAQQVVAGDPAAGEAIFWGKGCGQCHEVNERGGSMGSDLSEIGKNSSEYLKNAILNPNDPASGRHQWFGPVALSIKTRNGQVVEGMKQAEDNFSLILRDRDGNLRRFTRDEIVDEHVESKSLMPDDYATTLAPAEIENLVAYLSALKDRDLTKTVQEVLPAGLTFDRIKNSQAEPQNWLTYWGDYQGDHFSTLNQINTSNVDKLQARWAVQMPAGPLLEATPIVVDGTLYTTYTSSDAAGVYAIEARTGLVLWKYERRQKAINPYQTNPFNRGVAVLGERVFLGTLDAAMVALDARTGRVLWETPVADTMRGYSITEAPLAIKDEVIIGVAGGEFGIRGFVDAYDAATGKRLWRFHTVPGPGEFGHDTWSGDSWKHGSGATWLTGSYDPDSDMLYWTVGNPGPDLDPDVRKGDNLFTCSVLALDPATGKLKWYYQFTPNDTHDWDANEDVILADRTIDGVPRKLMLQADRNGIFYVLDRTNGKLVLGKPYMNQTWNGGFHPDGTPILLPNWKASPEGSKVAPSLVGGTDWNNPSYDRAQDRLYVTISAGGLNGFRSAPERYESGRQYMGGRPFFIPHQEHHGELIAIDTLTGDRVWTYRTYRESMAAGVTATSGGLVFLATGDGNLIALDAAAGKALWHFHAGDAIASAPISYAVNGEQYVAISAGNTLYGFALPD
jgi:PQQ-dependent dehydrogenase (methanol/ethanol family)